MNSGQRDRLDDLRLELEEVQAALKEDWRKDEPKLDAEQNSARLWEVNKVGEAIDALNSALEP